RVEEDLPVADPFDMEETGGLQAVFLAAAGKPAIFVALRRIERSKVFSVALNVGLQFLFTLDLAFKFDARVLPEAAAHARDLGRRAGRVLQGKRKLGRWIAGGKRADHHPSENCPVPFAIVLQLLECPLREAAEFKPRTRGMNHGKRRRVTLVEKGLFR